MQVGFVGLGTMAANLQKAGLRTLQFWMHWRPRTKQLRTKAKKEWYKFEKAVSIFSLSLPCTVCQTPEGGNV